MKKIIIILTALFIACDTCELPVSDNGGNSEADIFFSALPLNAEKLAVYKSDDRGNQIQHILNDASIFSAPSSNNKIAFVRTDSNSLNILYMMDIVNGQAVQIDKENSLFDIVHPIISPNGKNIAFLGGSGKLFVYNVTDAVLELVSGSVMANTLPTFSYDGSMIAYFVYEDNLSLQVKNVDNYDVSILNYDLGSYNFEEAFTNKPNWSFDSKSILYSVFDENNCFINITGLDGVNKFIEFDKNDMIPLAPSLNYNNSLLCFNSSNGNIWIVKNLDNPLFYKITDNNDVFYNSEPKWSPKENKLIFTSFNENLGNVGNLVLVALTDDNDVSVNEKVIVSNYSFNSFWR